jgi:hypothetical protein
MFMLLCLCRYDLSSIFDFGNDFPSLISCFAPFFFDIPGYILLIFVHFSSQVIDADRARVVYIQYLFSLYFPKGA